MSGRAVKGRASVAGRCAVATLARPQTARPGMPMSSVSATVLVPALAYLLDRLLGEPPLRWHPLV